MRLPASVQEIADVIGTERALYLIGQLPRCYVDRPGHKSNRVIMYVPKRLQPDHPLLKLLGWKDARRLVDAFGGEILQPANCADIYRQFRDRSIVRMAGEGMKSAAIAELMDVSDRHVRNLLREITQEDRKPENDNTPRKIKPELRARRHTAGPSDYEPNRTGDAERPSRTGRNDWRNRCRSIS